MLTDEKWFCFVLEQILSNALKYTKQGSVKISTEESAKWFKDFGAGTQASAFGKEDLPRILKKGFTGYNGRMDKKASGLDFICAKACEKLGHEIRVVSEEGEGTTVIIYFAVEKVQQRDLVNM